MRIYFIILGLVLYFSTSGQHLMLSGSGISPIEVVTPDTYEPVGWFDASDYDGDGIEEGLYETFGSWINKGSNGDNLDKDGSSPTLTTLNDKNSVYFAGGGSNQYLYSNSNSAWNFLHNGTSNTVFIVAYAQDPGTRGYLFGTGFSSAHVGSTFLYWDNSGEKAPYYSAVNGTSGQSVFAAIGSNGSWPLNETFYFRLESDASNNTISDRAEIYRNSTDLNISNTSSDEPNTTSNSTYRLAIGRAMNTVNNYYYKGYVSEMIFFDKALTSFEKANVEYYLSQKYGLFEPTIPPEPVDIVSDGLQSYVDASDPNSYSGTGSVWYDLSGNSQDWDITSATYQNALTPAYFSLNGTNNNINSQSGLLPGTEWTIGIWAKQSSVGDWIISDYDRYATYEGYIIGNNSSTGVLQLLGRDLSGNFLTFAQTNVDVSDNTWRYITATRNGNSYKLYVNGSLQGSGSGVNAGFTTNDKFYIGSRENNTYFNQVDVGEVHMYTRELDASEVQQNYSVTKDKYYPEYQPPSGSSPSSIAGLHTWLSGSDMDGDGIENEETPGTAAPTIWADKSGNGHNFVKGGNPIVVSKNGNNIVDFDGSGDYYVSNEDKSTWTFLHDGTQHTVFIAAKGSKGTTYTKTYNPFLGNNISSATVGFYVSIANNASYPNRFSNVVLRGVTSTYAATWSKNNSWYPTEWKYLTLINDYANSTTTSRITARLNGVVTASDSPTVTFGSPSGSVPERTLYVGWTGVPSSVTDNYLQGYIAEIIIYDRILSTSEIEQVEAYLSTKYGI